MRFRALLSEARRRHVVHVALVYGVVAIGVIEAADLLVPHLALPEVVTRAVVAIAVLGFPVAMVLAWALEWTPEGIRAASRGGPFEDSFVLDEEVCRNLKRERLDPRVIGDRLRYLDNHARSDTLFCYLHGFGHDASQFSDILREHPHRAVAPTMYGFEPDRSTRIPLDYEDHVALVRAFLAHVIRRVSPSAVVVVGFSAGADLALRVVGERGTEDLPVDGLLALGPNLGPDTLFVSRAFARIADDDPPSLPRALSSAGARSANLQEWLNTHEYLVRVVRKFQGDIEPLRRFAQGLVADFEGGHDGFIERYRAAAEHVGSLLVVIADSEGERAPLERIKVLNLDRGVLGERYRPGSLRVETGADHFELIDPARHRAQIEALFEMMARTAGPTAREKVGA